MGKTAQDIINWALSQVGYKEGSNNDNKYGKQYGLNNQPYCCIFVWCDFKDNGASDLFYGGKKTASCTTLYNWAKKNGQTVSVSAIQPGDVYFCDWDNSGDCDHVGICVEKSGSDVIGVEANTSKGTTGSQSNGDGVYKRKRPLKQVKRVWRPKYAASTTTNNSKGEYCKVELPVLKTGSKGNAVRSAQRLLTSMGYNTGGIDGDFGTLTAKAVKAFQKSKKLTQDAEIGKNTWTALLL